MRCNPWRIVFYILLPFGVIGFLIAWLFALWGIILEPKPAVLLTCGGLGGMVVFLCPALCAYDRYEKQKRSLVHDIEDTAERERAKSSVNK